MPLTCYCGGDMYEYAWIYVSPTDYTTMPRLPRRKRCASCKVLIEPDSTALKFERGRAPRSEVEETIYGCDWDAVPLAPWFLCEECSDLWLSLDDLGYCVAPDEVRSCHQEYVEMVQEERSRAACQRFHDRVEPRDR